MLDLKVGIKGIANTVVNEKNLAKTMKSGALAVFATPAMIALMEEASCNCVNCSLEKNFGTVGIGIFITHDKPSAIGSKITASAKLIKIEGRKLIFEVQANDEYGIIGKGTHERFIIDNEKFMNKLSSR